MTGFVIEQEVIVPAAECLQCGWRLDLPYRVYREAMSGDELVAWLAHVRPLLCRPDHVEATAPVALGDVGADALGLAEPAAPDFSLEGTQNGTE